MISKFRICEGYKLGKEINKSNYSRICLAYKDNKIFAFKYRERNAISEYTNIANLVQKEAEITHYLKSPNVVKLIDFKTNANLLIKDNKTIEIAYIILEYINGRDLLEYINYTGLFHENEARYYFSKLIKTMQIIHLKGYVHLDIKPQNIMVDEKFNLILIDFGSASKIIDSSEIVPFKEKEGTIQYLAPEIYTASKYDRIKVDIFSMGVVLFNMATGQMPFKIANQEDENYNKIMNNMYHEFWKNF